MRGRKKKVQVEAPQGPDVGDYCVEVYDDEDNMTDMKCCPANQYQEALGFFESQRNANLYKYMGWEKQSSRSRGEKS